MSRIVAFDHTPACDAGELPNVGRSADELVTWLHDHRALATGQPEDITLDGRPAQMIDVSLVPEWTQGCPDSPSPAAVLFGEIDKPGDGRLWAQLQGMKGRYILFDLGERDTVVIVIASSEDRFDQFVDEAMPIVESFTFE